MGASRHRALRAALDFLDQGDWNAAHKIAQSDASSEGCWAHGIVHLMEGDLDNARYWYERAQRVFSADVATEISALKKALS